MSLSVRSRTQTEFGLQLSRSHLPELAFVSCSSERAVVQRVRPAPGNSGVARFVGFSSSLADHCGTFYWLNPRIMIGSTA